LRHALAAFLATGVLTTGACRDSGRSPLIPLAPVSRLRVRNAGASPHEHGINDRAILDSVVRFATGTRGWDQSWHTLPAGEYLVDLIHDSAVAGRLWFGSNYVVAKGATPSQSGALIRSASEEEIERLRAWLDLDRYDSSEAACGAFANHFYDRLYLYKDEYADQDADVATRVLALRPSVLTPALERLLAADVAAQSRSAGEIVSLTGDFDPFSASQDPAPAYVASAHRLQGKVCPVSVTPVLASPSKGAGIGIVWFVFESEGWKIADVTYKDSTTLVGELQRWGRSRGESTSPDGPAARRPESR